VLTDFRQEAIIRSSIVRKMTLHVKCRNGLYATTNDKKRAPVPDDKVKWSVTWPNYEPLDFTAEHVKKAVWADPQKTDKIIFNKNDGKVDRTSFESYQVIDGLPQNPRGRTGIKGRGFLGKWGPNHAADPVLTKWKRDSSGKQIIDKNTKRPILMFVGICRSDTGEWAIPGGMVDAGENISQALKREFGEEALDTDNHPERKLIAERILSNGVCIYQGYVDDPRNTDNSWMETQVYNYHDENDELKFVQLQSGSDASAVKWIEINSKLNLYASHSLFIQKTAEKLNAHW